MDYESILALVPRFPPDHHLVNGYPTAAFYKTPKKVDRTLKPLIFYPKDAQDLESRGLMSHVPLGGKRRVYAWFCPRACPRSVEIFGKDNRELVPERLESRDALECIGFLRATAKSIVREWEELSHPQTASKDDHGNAISSFLAYVNIYIELAYVEEDAGWTETMDALGLDPDIMESYIDCPEESERQKNMPIKMWAIDVLGSTYGWFEDLRHQSRLRDLSLRGIPLPTATSELTCQCTL